MGAISSINFKKSNVIQTRHNDRDLPPNYLIGGDCECNRTHQEALTLKNQIIKNSIEKYTEITGQKFQAKSYEWSAVVNIKSDTTMRDLEKLSEHFETKYGFQCYQIAIHRDEGHINEQGQKEINHHAHLEFITLNKENGRNMWRRELITPKVLRQMQSEVAEILGMQRGQDKRITKRERIEPRKYAQMKEAEKKGKKELKQELLSIREVKERLETERKKMLQENKELKEANENAIYNADDYKKLRKLKEQQDLTLTELNEQIQRLKDEAKKRETQINELESDLRAKEQKNDDLYQKIREIDLNANSELENTINELKLENEQIKQELKQTWKAKETIAKGKYEEYPKIAQEILSDYEKAKSDSIKRATQQSGIFKKTTIDYEKAFNNFVEAMDNEHNTIKKAILNEPLNYYETKNTVIKHIKGYLEKSKEFANNIFNDIRKKKDEFIENLQRTIKNLKSKITDLENENINLKNQIANFKEFYKDTQGKDLTLELTSWQIHNGKDIFAKKQSVESILTEKHTPKTRQTRKNDLGFSR